MVDLGPLSESDLQQLAPAALAYLGDAVYELFVRRFYLMPPKRMRAYHQQAIASVRAESQARALQAIEPLLTPAELEVVRRGRNAATRCPSRLDRATYQQATALETLVGYLYLSDGDRLYDLLERIHGRNPSQG